MVRKTYPEEFRRKIVDLHSTGQSVASLAREFGPTAQTIRKWVDESSNESDSSANAEHRRMVEEMAYLKEENAILKKAAAWFAKETLKTPRRSFRS